MGKATSSRATVRKSSASEPIRYIPGKGLAVSTTARFPNTADDKIVTAKSVVQAVIAAHDSRGLEDENYDIHWPLSLVVDLLEQASTQLSGSNLPKART